MAELDLFDVEAFNRAYSEASKPYFEPERLADFSLLAKRRALTLAQVVLLMLHAVDDADEASLAYAYADYIRAVSAAVVDERLEARHPATFLTWGHCMELLRGGSYGEHGERAPLLHFGWLVGLDDLTIWLAECGFDIDVSGLLQDLNSDTQCSSRLREGARRWTDAFIEEVRQFRAHHTAAETAARYGVSTRQIRKKLEVKKGTADGSDFWAALK